MTPPLLLHVEAGATVRVPDEVVKQGAWLAPARLIDWVIKVWGLASGLCGMIGFRVEGLRVIGWGSIFRVSSRKKG